MQARNTISILKNDGFGLDQIYTHPLDWCCVSICSFRSAQWPTASDPFFSLVPTVDACLAPQQPLAAPGKYGWGADGRGTADMALKCVIEVPM